MRLSGRLSLGSNSDVLLLCIATFLVTSGQGITVPILPLYAHSLGLNAAEVGLAVSAFGLARFLTNMPSAVISDRFGRRSILMGGAFATAVGNVLSAFATSLPSLLAYRFIAGIGSAAFITGAVIFIADISTPANRGRLVSIYQASFLMGIGLGPAAGGIVAQYFGLQSPFFVVGAVSVAGGIWTFLRVPETRRSAQRREAASSNSEEVEPTQGGAREEDVSSEPPKPSYRFLFSRDFILIALVFIGTFFTRGGAQFTLLPLKAASELHLSEGQIGLLFAAPAILNFAVLPFVGPLSDRYGRKRAIVPGMYLFALSLLFLGFSPTLAPFTVGMLLYGLAQGIAGPTPIAYVADITPPGGHAIAQGAARSLGDFALLAAPPLMGLAADLVSATPTLLVDGALMAVVGVVFMVFASDPARRAAREREAATAER